MKNLYHFRVAIGSMLLFKNLDEVASIEIWQVWHTYKFDQFSKHTENQLSSISYALSPNMYQELQDPHDLSNR